ncbi:MAG: DUF1294 domain-containing protein [Lachnospiraceae bacterium]|nr:DUF1294 domain-containing protein [Lachnospiraceae bacterium]
MPVISIILGYIFFINIVGFSLMGIDKRKAIKKVWRIPESTLFIVALIGGSIGSIIGMNFFRHKTKHWYFVLGMPLILIAQIAAIIVLIKMPIQFTIL